MAQGSEEKPSDPIIKPEEKTSSLDDEFEPDSEEKTSDPDLELEENSSEFDLQKVRNMGGRLHKHWQILEILDRYIETGDLPTYVSDRQRYAYRHHKLLGERRVLFESTKHKAVTKSRLRVVRGS